MSDLDLKSALFDTLLSAPWPTMIVEESGRIAWLNQSLADWLGRPPGSTEGLSVDDLPDPSWHALLDAACTHFEAIFPGKAIRTIARTRVNLESSGWEAHYFNDVTEHQRIRRDIEILQEQVRFLETKDPDTGLLNRNAILQALDAQLTRSRRYGNPLSVIKLWLASAQTGPFPGLRRLTEDVNSRMRWADQVGRVDEQAFLLILPETSLAEAEKLADRLTGDSIGKTAATGWSLHSRVTCWERGDDARRLLQRLDEAYP